MNSRSGLICAGGVTNSSLARMPAVLATVGPVLSVSQRVARRMSNALRAGRAVNDPEALASCRVVWIAAANHQLDRLVAAARPFLDNKIVVLCDSPRDSGSLAVRAYVATLNPVDPGETVLACEGHAEALRFLQRVAVRERRKLIELRPGSKATFLAAANLAGRLILPAFAASVEGFRAAGFARADATRAAESLAIPALHSYTKAGRKAWTGPGFPADVKDPRLAAVYRESVQQALHYFGTL